MELRHDLEQAQKARDEARAMLHVVRVVVDDYLSRIDVEEGR